MARPRGEACRAPGAGVRVAVEPQRHAGPVEAPPGRQGLANCFDYGKVGVAVPDVTGTGAKAHNLGGVPDDQEVAGGGAAPKEGQAAGTTEGLGTQGRPTADALLESGDDGPHQVCTRGAAPAPLTPSSPRQ